MSRIGEAMMQASGAARERGEAIGPVVAGTAAVRTVDQDTTDTSPWQLEPSAPVSPVSGVQVPRLAATNGSIVATAAAPLASLRETPSLAVFRGFNPEIEERVVVSGRVAAHGVEQYRRFAASLHQVQVDRGVRIVMVTSAAPGEGKSLTSTNLALTLSESYRRRVLLVDADLRRPSLHDIFQVPNTTGLSDGLRRENPTTFATLQITDALSLLPAGRPDPDPMASLTSPRLKHLIDEARHKFDWVVIDTPPVALMADASLLADRTDGVVLVVKAGDTPFDIVKQAAKALGRKKILGVVLNRAHGDPAADYAGY